MSQTKTAPTRLLTDPNRLPVTCPIKALTDDMNAARHGGTIYLFCGEASPYVYNSHQFVETAHQLHNDRGVKIVAITGPILLVPEGTADLAYGDVNGLLGLKRDSILTELYHRRARYSTSHFRVVETGGINRYYAEYPHPPLAPGHERSCANLKKVEHARIHEQSEEAIQLFNSWKARAVQHEQAGAEHLPLLTTKSKLRPILAEASKRGLVFDYLDAEEMLEQIPGARAALTPYQHPPTTDAQGTPTSPD